MRFVARNVRQIIIFKKQKPIKMSWASISRDIMQKLIQHLQREDALDAVMWIALGRVCKHWRHCIASLPDQLKSAWNQRLVQLSSIEHLEPFLLRHYPHRIHALSPMAVTGNLALAALTHILKVGCNINVFQLDPRLFGVAHFLRIMGICDYHHSMMHSFYETYTGDLFIFTPEVYENIPKLLDLEMTLKTSTGQPVFSWHAYDTPLSPYSIPSKREFLISKHRVLNCGMVFIFRNREPCVNEGIPCDFSRRTSVKKLREPVSKKRSRPSMNEAEHRLVRLCQNQGKLNDDC